MARVVWLILLVGALGAGIGPEPASAQRGSAVPPAHEPGTGVNLFETLDPSSSIDGVRLELPDGWTVRTAHLLRYGTSPVPVHVEPGPQTSTVYLTANSPIQGPHELVVQVETADKPGTLRWHLTPFVTRRAPEARDSVHRQMRRVDRVTRTVEIDRPSRPSGKNQALDLTNARAPMNVQVPADLAPSRSRSFTVEFWMQTKGLDEVILSSWTGDETTPYPLEFVTDQGGRLRFYCGQAGRHQALRSTEPVADGRWHHAAVVYDETESRLHLMLDGSLVDSVQNEALPTHSGPLSLALGGRRETGPTRDDATPAQRFDGRIDELRIWPAARSASTIRRMRKQPLAQSSDDADLFRLSFDDDSTPVPLDRLDGARRVPTHLSFEPPLRRLRAHTDGESVTLRWDAQMNLDNTREAGEFVVERSPDGSAFTSVDRLSPSDAETSAGSGREFTYTDDEVPGRIAFYRVRYVSSDADAERTTGTIKIGLGGEPTAERVVDLVGNFPNPFSEATTIAYQVEESQPLTLTVWNLSGKRIATLADGVHEPGYYEQTLSAGELPSGTYFARLETPKGIQSARMVLLK